VAGGAAIWTWDVGVSGVKDAAGQMFSFNGEPALGLNPLLPTRSKKPISVVYDGTRRVESGFFMGNGSAPTFAVKFTKKGTYKVFCNVHYNTTATVVVLPKSRPVPSAAHDRAALIAQLKAAVNALQAAAKIKPPADTVNVGSAGPGGAELYAMFPSALNVKAGTTVTFKISPDSREVHTVTFGPTSYLTTLANGFLSNPQLTQQALYPSDVPKISISPTTHGNGFVNLGPIDADPTTRQPASGTVTFTAPGTYHYHYTCLIHPIMRGTIVVTR